MRSTKAVLIPFDESKPVEAVELAPGLDAIYAYVAPDSRMFEVTRGNSFDLLGDEEGGPLMRNDASERINARAMQVYAADQNASLKDFRHPLCGDFLAVGQPDERGNHTDVPGGVLEFNYTWTTTPVETPVEPS